MSSGVGERVRWEQWIKNAEFNIIKHFLFTFFFQKHNLKYLKKDSHEQHFNAEEAIVRSPVKIGIFFYLPEYL